jgi:hypothetical protein
MFSWAHIGAAQEPAEDDHAAVIEVGAASEHSVSGGSSSFGAALGIEVTPIENWLELEFGVAALRSSAQTELSSDLVFKKPFRLTETSEFMIGLGPFVSRTVSGAQSGTSHGIEVDLDFMFWPRKDIGWYLEPSWSRTSASGERTIGLTVGLLFGWR